MRKDKTPTFTSIFEKWLAQQDDFVTVAQIRAGTGMDTNHVTACLSHFKRYKAVDFIVQDGTTFWFGTPDTDTRTTKMEEKAKEEPGSRRRGSRI